MAAAVHPSENEKGGSRESTLTCRNQRQCEVEPISKRRTPARPSRPAERLAIGKIFGALRMAAHHYCRGGQRRVGSGGGWVRSRCEHISASERERRVRGERRFSEAGLRVDLERPAEGADASASEVEPGRVRGRYFAPSRSVAALAGARRHGRAFQPGRLVRVVMKCGRAWSGVSESEARLRPALEGLGAAEMQ